MRNANTTSEPTLIFKLSDKTTTALRSNSSDVTRFREYLDTGQYRASDVGISYRALNAIDEAGLLPDYNLLPRGNGWRSFSLREAIYLQILFMLKAFGMTNAKLKSLLDFLESRKYNGIDPFLAYAVGSDITVLVFSDGNGLVLDKFTLVDYEKSNPANAAIRFSLNHQIDIALARLNIAYKTMQREDMEERKCVRRPN